MTAPMDEAEMPRSYLPIPCPICGRHRLLATIMTDEDGPFVYFVRCEKCESEWPNDR